LAGADAARRVLRAALAAGRWGRPFLLLGRGEDRDAAAREFLRGVLCAARPAASGASCGACGSCGRFDRGLHPDFHLLLPEKGRATVGVDAVEGLQRALSLRPAEGRGTAALVPGAERLTPQAQNALLKTLEEPPPRTALVLTAAAPRALLPTVRSRCASVRLPPLPLGSLLEEAAGGDPAVLEEAAGALAAAFAPGPRGADPLEGLDPVSSWVRGRGSPLEEQRERLRMAIRLLLGLHMPRDSGEVPAPLRAGYNALPPAARGARLAALGTARERVERNVDPAGILEALAVAVREADRGASPLKS